MLRSFLRLLLALGFIILTLVGGVPLRPSVVADTTVNNVVVNPVPGLPRDFIMGVDASEAPWIIELGGRYYDLNGEERDLLDILWENGVNWIRLRVWNDPYDVNGTPYGGGNCDLERMTRFAAEAKARGFKILIDFHYSDWWADPSKQEKPKAWVNLSYNELVEAVYNWTRDALLYMRDHGALPDMVQVGNEINNGFLWPDGAATRWSQFTGLLKSAISAVRSVDPNIGVVIHLAGVKGDFYVNFIDRLIDSGVDFDVIGISYYPYYHGSMDEFRSLVGTLASKYSKGIIVAETAYAWTLSNGDNHPNSFGSRVQEVKGGYKATVQGQASFIRDLIAALYEEGGSKALGVFYWGATWIPYPGAGWKTGEGNPWDNQALFDFNGCALPSIRVFRLVYEAQPFKVEPRELYDPSPVNVTAYAGAKPILPSSILVVYTDDSIRATPVDWGDIPVYSSPGNYTYKGHVVNTSIEVTAWITVLERLSVEIMDPQGDDRGIGTYGYPTADVYKPGVFDVTRVLVEVTGDNISFRIYFADLGGNPWSGPNGFSLQYIQVYIRTMNPLVTNNIFRKDTFGLNIELREDYQWQYALLISPGWGNGPLLGGEFSALYYSNGTVYVEDKDFNVVANTSGNYVEAIIPRSLMPDWENLKYWRILVFATSWAGENPDRIHGFTPGGGEWMCDATKYAKPEDVSRIASAIVVGVLPKLYDLAIYSSEYPDGASADQQYTWLSQFDPSTRRMATIPPPQVPTVTITSTTTITETVTRESTMTVTETVTTTYMGETSTTTVTKTVETPVTQGVEVLSAMVYVVIALLAGIVAGLLTGRRLAS